MRQRGERTNDMKDSGQVTRKRKFDRMRDWLVDKEGGQDGEAPERVCLYLLVSQGASPSPQEIAWATGLAEGEVYPALHDLIRECEAKYGPRSAGHMRGILGRGVRT